MCGFCKLLLYRSDYSSDSKEEIIKFLVEFEKTDVNCMTSRGQTPLDLVHSSENIRLLLKHGASPTYELYNEFFPHHLRKDPTDMSIKMFVLGNPGAGKSTLVESLKTEETGTISRFMNRYTKVKNVNMKTAGIIPHDLNSALLGKVSIYDFAGHEEFHSGHGALLSNSMANSPSIVILVIDMREDDHKIEKAVLYWLEFINNQCCEEDPKPHLVMICSHTDQAKNEKSNLNLARSLVKRYKFNLVRDVTIDCRYAESSSMSELRSILAQSCQVLRSSETMEVDQHCFLVFLLDKCKDKVGITLNEIRLIIKDEAYFKFLKSCNILEICEQLNKRGDILFMKNHQNSDSSWIILSKTTLLATINGILFAPEGFKEHQNIATSTGVVPLSKLNSLFPDLDSDMIRQFLCHLEFCQEIADSKILQLLPADDILYNVEDSERFYFFPGLVHDVTPKDLWPPNDELVNHIGWAIQCSKPEQFLTPRFLQVLLLRLAFHFALAPSEALAANHPALQRRCKIWKNGISWVNVNGGEAIVEVSHQRQVAVVTRCNKKNELESGRLLSSIIHKVLEAKHEHCLNVVVKESVISSEDAACYSYPLDLTKATTISIKSVANTVKELNAIYFMPENTVEHIDIDKILYFEPYINLGEEIVKYLLDEHDPKHHQEIAEDFIESIAGRMHNKTGNYIAVFRNQLTPTSGNVQELIQEFQKWKAKNATCCNIHKQLDRFSIFAGRNPLKVAEGIAYSKSK